ncbi:hypothetical protein WJX72_002761 [[Myrmecia] bisecta]|uniref:LTV1 n=1 Tax=[Myrmecia] bisecta TaxID=41462 RepID=A0AAW1QEH9_9CHLO
MVRKRTPFIDKSRATSYTLVYRSTDDADNLPERQLIETDKHIGIGRPDVEAAAAAAAHAPARKYPPGHPLSWLEDEVQDNVSEARRQELIANGFPDDGYDYMKHLRLLGQGKASLEGVKDPADAREQLDLEQDGFAGPSIFVPAPSVAPPEEDVKMFDARRLTVHAPAQTDDAAAQAAGGVTAFSREAVRVQAASMMELQELLQMMSRVQAADELGDAEGAGDMLDDFVLEATGAGEGEGDAAVSAQLDPDSASASVSGQDEESDNERRSWTDGDASGSDGDEPAEVHQPRRAGSIASTYWRPERRDRKENLSVIDERFEHLALEYDSDEIGELDDEEVGGQASLDQFGGLMDQFLEDHRASVHAHESGLRYSTAADTTHASAAEAADAAIAVLKARERLRVAESMDDSRPAGDGLPHYLEEDEQAERWDCESVLSLRSNLDNHPAQIGESGMKPRLGQRALAHQIRLSGKTGMPVGYVGPQKKAASESGQELRDDASVLSHSSPLPPRVKGEGAEEKKQRKQAVKEAKRDARATKKDLKVMYKKESVKQQKYMGAPAPSVLRIP